MANSSGAQQPSPDWVELLRGKCLLPERIAECNEAVRAPYNTCLSRGQWDYRRMARVLDTPALAELLSTCDPSLRTTEDKCQQVRNILIAFEHVAPALAYGKVHDALVKLHTSADKDWDCRLESLAALRSLLEGCACTPAGMKPFKAASLAGVVGALGEYMSLISEEGMAPKWADGLDHCLESLFSILRYRENEAVEAAKEALWEEDVPAVLLDLALAPATAYGHEEGVPRDAGLEQFLSAQVNFGRVLTSMCHRPGDPIITVQAHGELLSYPGAFLSIKAIIATAADLLYSCKYEALCGEHCQETGGALMRNALALVGSGAMFAPTDAITELKEAGWEPLLRQMRADRSYRGHYRPFFRAMADLLLRELPVWRGVEAEGQRLGGELMNLTLVQSQPPSAVQQMQNQPRPPSPADIENRRAVGQVRGPDGLPLNIYEVTLASRDYSKACAACGKSEEEMAAEGRKLSICTGCRRARYCGRACHKGDWKAHKEMCQLYQRQRQQEEEEQEGGGAGGSAP